MTRWEYHNASTSASRPSLLKSELDALGKEGWELVAVASRGPDVGLLYVFKRESST